jgi:hypothetical protein
VAHQYALDRLLAAGPMPPRAAFELVGMLADEQRSHGHLADGALRPARVNVARDGAVDIDRLGLAEGNADSAARGLGGLVYEAISGEPWADDDAARRRQRGDLESLLSLWPAGAAMSALFGEMVAGTVALDAIAARCRKIREEASGLTLTAWVGDSLTSISATPAPAPLWGGPDEVTVNFPPGMLKSGRTSGEFPKQDSVAESPAHEGGALAQTSSKATPGRPSRSSADDLLDVALKEARDRQREVEIAAQKQEAKKSIDGGEKKPEAGPKSGGRKRPPSGPPAVALWALAGVLLFVLVGLVLFLVFV